MQCIHPEDDLLQRSRRNDAGEHQIHRVQIGSVAAKRGAGPNRGHQSLIGEDHGLMPPRGRRLLQLLSVPASAGGEHGDTHAYLVSAPIKASNPPVANLERSPATFLKPGVATPFFRAAMEGK